MRIVLVLMTAIVLAAPFAAALNESTSTYDEWLGIGGLRIVDVHHTEEYIAKMANISGENGTEWLEPGVSTLVAGIWSFSLAGENDTRRLDLTLYQAESEVFGEGTMTSKDGTRLIAAAGNATSNLLDLRIVVLGDPGLIRARLSLLATPAQGRYAFYTPSGLAGSGAAFGYWTAPLPSSGAASAGEPLPPDLAGSFSAGHGAV